MNLYSYHLSNLSFNFHRDLEAFFLQFYIQTLPWICPVMLGIIFAYFLPKFQQASYPDQRKIMNTTISSLITCLPIIGYMYISEKSPMKYLVLQTIWPVGISVLLSILIVLFHPKSLLISYKITPKTNQFLWHISRISYQLYLVHYILFIAFLNATPSPGILNPLSFFCIFLGYLSLIYLATIFLHIFIESPSKNIRKIFNL